MNRAKIQYPLCRCMSPGALAAGKRGAGAPSERERMTGCCGGDTSPPSCRSRRAWSDRQCSWSLALIPERGAREVWLLDSGSQLVTLE